MNPRGRQYALAGTLDGWAHLTELTWRQRWALDTAYRGLNPFTMSRYGRRQWTTPLPWTRVVIKDPFAVLSIPAVAAVTGATTVLLYRHPGALLASYRRMGWTPDLDEMRPLLSAHGGDLAGRVELPQAGSCSETAAMGAFWAAIYAMALDDVVDRHDVFVVSHERLSLGGTDAVRQLFGVLGLSWTAESAAAMSAGGDVVPGFRADDAALHRFDRRPEEVAEQWRQDVTSDEIVELDRSTREVHELLDAACFQP